MGYYYLAFAIVLETAATAALKSSNEFTKLVPSIIVFLGYGSSLYLLSLVLKTVPVGVAYAIWAGLGLVLITLVSAVLFKQVPDLPTIIGMVLIVSGVIVMNVFSNQ